MGKYDFVDIPLKLVKPTKDGKKVIITVVVISNGKTEFRKCVLPAFKATDLGEALIDMGYKIMEREEEHNA